jgi:DNA-binding IclR family transcriptional regulator
MASEQGQKVLDTLEAEGPQLPIVVLARLLDVPPSRLVDVLDELYDAGLLTPGRERGTVVLVPQPQAGEGRFARPRRSGSAAPNSRG